MLSKILAVGSISLLNSALSLVLTMLIINIAGVSIVGDIYLFLAICSLALLPNIILPPSFSIVKIQEYQNYVKYLFCAYFYMQFISILICVLYFHDESLNNLILISAYVCLSSWINFYDIIFQSKGLLKSFYFSLLLSTVFKVVAVYLCLTENAEVKDILVWFVLGQVISLLYLYIVNSFFGRRVRGLFKLSGFIIFYKSVFKNVKSFYLSAALKRVFDNIPALLLSPFLSNDVLGIFSLYQKCLIFGVSYIRIIESVLLSRKSGKFITQKIRVYSAIISILMTFVGGAIYFQVTIGIDVNYLLWASLLIIPISITINCRAFYIKKLCMKKVNVAMTLSIFISVLYSLVFSKDSLNFALETYTLLLCTQAVWLLFSFYSDKS
jgi:O-antigen/teichoic acid export membrane protein